MDVNGQLHTLVNWPVLQGGIQRQYGHSGNEKSLYSSTEPNSGWLAQTQSLYWLSQYLAFIQWGWYL
jgi:hypothetical protein